MDRYINLTPEIEKAIWEKGVFIFDTSSICEMYKLNQDARESVSHIITNLKNRIWIPGHVQYEYSKNRIDVINETIKKVNLNSTRIKNLQKPTTYLTIS